MQKLALIFSTLITMAFPVGDAQAAEYQFSVPTDQREGRAFLWIPPGCMLVRGLLLGSQVILEKKAFDDPIIREACTRENLGIVILFHTSLGRYPDRRKVSRNDVMDQIRQLAAEHQIDVEIRKESAGATQAAAGHDDAAGVRTMDVSLQKILDDLAAESGYSEIATAPLLTAGHSGGAIFAWNVAYLSPQRILGVIGIHSAVILPPEADPKARPEGFPALCISGEYESWMNPKIPLDQHWRWLRGGVLNMRGCYDTQACEIVQPGASHFNWDPPLARYVAMFIEKAAHYRIPPDSAGGSPATQPEPLKTLPMESGWLTDTMMMSPSRYPPAPYAQFKNDPSMAFWHMDQELAEAADSFTKSYGGTTDQRVTFVQDGKPIPASWIEAVKFEPLEDGLTVKLAATFLDKTPEGVAGAGQPLGHADGPIKFRLIGGWGGGGEQTGPDTFGIRFDHFGTGRSCCNLQVMAYQDGDSTFKYAEQPCQIQFPEKNTLGKPQTIDFPKIDDVDTTSARIPLKATSDSGLPVHYYVRQGPAVVEGSILKLTPIPPRATYPVKVTVVAYQWGRGIDPLVQSAEPIQQTFGILKKQKS